MVRSGTVRIEKQEFVTVSLSALRVGATLRAPVYDASGQGKRLLLASGTTVTSSLLSRLAQSGKSQIRASANDLGRVTTTEDQTRIHQQNNATPSDSVYRPAGEMDRAVNKHWATSVDSFVNEIRVHGRSLYDPETTVKFVTNYNDSVNHVDRLMDGLVSGNVNDAGDMAAVSSSSLLELAEDFDLFVSLGLTPERDKYPGRHSLQTAMLAMSIGTLLGLKRDELIELGIGCLLHDAGMLRIKPELIESDRVLNQIEFLEIMKHPNLTFDMMQTVQNIPNGARMVAYQMHERCDGSGYPRERQGDQIHYLAKISAVADVFVAMVSPRPHRPGIMPYHAVEQILYGARAGKFDQSVVRALLKTISLFPIGSFIEANDGRVGQVIRSNRDFYTQPVIELWLPNDPYSKTEIVDLSSEQGLDIVRPLEVLEKPRSGDFSQTEPEAVAIDSLGSDADHWE